MSECKERWKNLRAVFVRHIKPPPSGTHGKAKKPYYLAEAMQFTLPYIKALGAPFPGNLPDIPEQAQNIPEPAEEDEESQSEAPTVQPSSPPPPPPPAQQPITSSQREEAHLPQVMLTDTADSRSKKIARKSQKRTLTDVDNSFMEYLNAKKKKVATTSNESSQAKKMFLLGLLPELEPMTDTQMRLFRRKVLQLIDEIVSLPPETPTYSFSTTSSTRSSGSADYVVEELESLSQMPLEQPPHTSTVQHYYEVVREVLEDTANS